MCMEKTPWETAVEFHGHACPGLALGFKAAEAALGALKQDRDVDEEMIAIVENDSCAIDAIQSVLSCTAGKGNMVFRNTGKQVFTIGSRKDGQAVRVALKLNAMSMQNGETREERIQRILHTNPADLFEVKEVSIDLPKKAVIFKTVQCSKCGEGVMESKAHLAEGNTVCPDCFTEYTRGW